MIFLLEVQDKILLQEMVVMIASISVKLVTVLILLLILMLLMEISSIFETLLAENLAELL